jgi:hypothetical protein
MLKDTPIPDELRLGEHDAVTLHAGQKTTANSNKSSCERTEER